MFPVMHICSIAHVESLVSGALYGQITVKSRDYCYLGFHFFIFCNQVLQSCHTDLVSH